MSGIQWTTRDYIYVTAECVTGVLSMLGNGLVLVAIKKSHSLRTVTNCFIGSLAAADALVGLVIPPTVILSYLGLPREFYGCVLVNSLVVLITNISILSLLAVALERFMAVRNPFLYQRVMSVNRALLVVAVTWIIAILIGLIPLMGWNNGSDDFQFCAFVSVIDLKFMVYLIFFGMTVPLLLAMLVIYLYIFHIIRQQRKRTRAQTQLFMTAEMRRSLRQRKQEVRGAKGLAYVIILFTVCWLPIHIMNCLTVFAPEKSAPYEWLLAAIVLSHANSVVNPFLYAFSNSKFKYAMKRILCCGRGVPTDHESIGELTWLRQKMNGLAPKERQSNDADYQYPSTLASSDTLTADVETAQPPTGELLNASQFTSISTLYASLPESSTQKRTSDSASKPSPSEQTVCNGIETHAGKILSNDTCLDQREVADKTCRESNTMDISGKYSGPITVIITGEDLKITDASGPDTVWMTTSSQSIEQQQSLHRQQTMGDPISCTEERSIKDKQGSVGDSVFDQANLEHSVDLSFRDEGVTQADNGKRKPDMSSQIETHGTTQLYQLFTVTELDKTVMEKEDQGSGCMDREKFRHDSSVDVTGSENFLSIRL